MKNSNSLARPVACLSLVLVLACLPGVLRGDQKGLIQPATTSDSKTAAYDLEIVDGQLIRPGGKLEATLPNVVDALRDRYTEANIVLAPGAAKVKLGDLRLRAGRLAEVLQAVRVASGDKFEVEGPNGPNPPMDPTTGLPVAGSQNLNAVLFVLRESRPTPETQRVVEAFNIGPYLEWSSHQPGTTEDQNLQNVQRMISETLEEFENGANHSLPIFRYHRGATMLVIIGNIESIEIARKIVNALPGMTGVTDSSRARYGLDSPRDPAASDRKARDRAAADAAFRARYGIPISPAASPQPGTAAPEPVPPK